VDVERRDGAAKEADGREARASGGDYQPIQFYEFYKVLAQNGGTFFNATRRSDLRQSCGIAACSGC